MNIPFLRFFKKDKADEGSVAVAPQPVASIEKPSEERLGKTFIPHSSRVVGLAPPAASSPAQVAPSTPRKISLGGRGSIAVGPKVPGSAATGERTIALSFADLVPGLPSELLKPGQLDHERCVFLKAAEVERGMATGRPSVLLRAIYNAVPEFFTSEVPATDLREVALPFNKVVEQFASFQVRDDQVADQEYPQLETPFLQVTLEDNERFGKSGTPPAAGKIPAVKPEAVAEAKPKVVAASPPAAQAAPSAPPDAAAKPKDPIRFSMPAAASAPAATPAAKTPPPLDQPPKVTAAAPAPLVVAPKSSVPISTPAAPAAASAPAATPTAKAPPPLDQPAKVVAASPPADQAATSAPADAAAKPKDPIRFFMPAPVGAPAATPTAKTPPPLDQPPKLTAAAPAPPAVAPEPSAPISPPSVPAAASAPAAAPTAKAPSPLNQPPPSLPTAANISPNGTGVPAAERVPVSSGSPVPTLLPSPFAPLPPTRIPFKVSPPSDDLRSGSKFPAPLANQDAIDLANSDPRISLPLRNILRDVAPFQLSGPIDAVPDTVQIEIPFSIVKSQLSLGRVAISPAQFLAALPEEYRTLFKADPAGTPVPLSLQDVLQNLPSESLQLRGDQEEPEVGEAFETPFSQKADEDAARMKVPAGPVAKTTAARTEADPKPVAAKTESAAKPSAPAAEPAAKPAPAPAEATAQAAATLPKEASVEFAKVAPAEPAKETTEPAPATAPKAEVAPATEPTTDTPAITASWMRTALQKLLDTDELLDAKSVVGHVSRLPGVSACAIVFSDGLSLAGNIPEEYEAEALCAMAPSIMKRIGEQMFGAKLGALNGLTLFCAKMPVSLFAHGNICLAAIHSGGEIAAEVRDRLGQTTQELARMYAEQPNA